MGMTSSLGCLRGKNSQRHWLHAVPAMEGIHRERTNLTFRFWALEGRGFHVSMVIGVDGSPGMVLKPLENNGINYQPQLVQDFSHQQ